MLYDYRVGGVQKGQNIDYVIYKTFQDFLSKVLKSGVRNGVIV